MLRTRVLPFIVWCFYRTLYSTWRIRVYEHPEVTQLKLENKSYILAHWHGDELAILHQLKPCRACAMVSTSKDGELMASVIHLLGAKTSRGSSTRGGVSALRGILKLAKEGWRPSVAVDGPKGPIYKVKPGVFEISRMTTGPIVPMGAAASSSHVFEKAWNKTYLPFPFAKVQVVYLKPLPAVGRDQDARSLDLASTLEQALADARALASNLIATT